MREISIDWHHQMQTQQNRLTPDLRALLPFPGQSSFTKDQMVCHLWPLPIFVGVEIGLHQGSIEATKDQAPDENPTQRQRTRLNIENVRWHSC